MQWAMIAGGPPNPGHGMMNLSLDGEVHITGWQDPTTLALGHSRWNGVLWTHTNSVFMNYVYASASLTSGDIVAGAELVGSISTYCPLVAWDGSAWSTMPALPNQFSRPSSVVSIASMVDGDVVAGGYLTFWGAPVEIVRYHAGQWSALPPRPGISSLGTMVGLANGDLLTGAWDTGVTFVHRWDGSAWSLLGTFGPLLGGSEPHIYSICELANGYIAVTGNFGSANGVPTNSVAIFDGTSWSALGTGIAGSHSFGWTVEPLPNGDLVVGGSFTNVGGIAAANIARWNGTAWSALGAGVTGGGFPMAYQIASRPQGDIVVTGFFTHAGGQPNNGLARLVPPCPATTSNLGNGCASSAGPMQLTSRTLPWIGSTFRTTTTGIALNGISFGLVGLNASAVPLVALHPAGQPGCTLLLDPILTILCATAGGSADFALPLANQPALVGIPLHHQVLQAELTPGFDIIALAGSNALALVIGSL